MAWIRSQDQNFLSQVQTVAYHPSRNSTNGPIIHELRNYSESFDDEIGRILGEWDTKKAALAELDCIERWISTGAADVYQVGGG